MLWLTSDLHLGHDKAAAARGFASVAEHDNALLAALAGAVAPADDLFVLGDVAFGDKERAAELLAAVPGRKHLILGNHDRQHPANGTTHRAHAGDFRGVFESVQLATVLRHDGVKLLLSHLPYDGDQEDEERLVQWRLRDLGAPLAHGHLHDAVRFRRSALGTPMVHVGVDAWGLGPVALPEVIEVLRAGAAGTAGELPPGPPSSAG